MKLIVNRPVEIEVVAIKCELAVRYEEEDIPNYFPLRHGDMWIGTVDIDTGVIRDWPQGKAGSMHMKVCDEGTYTLLGPKGEEIVCLVEEYVPHCIPGDDGDYVQFDIDETGKVIGWDMYCTKYNISESFFRGDAE